MGLIAILGVLGIAFMVQAYSSFTWGLVASVYYGWFVLPYFSTFPVFTVTQFVGFTMFVNVIIRQVPSFIQNEYKDTSMEWSYLILGPWITLLLGWCIHSIWF